MIDTLDSSLLYTRADGTEDFVHDTMRDFFLAKKAQDAIMQRDPTCLERVALTRKSLSFLFDMQLNTQLLYEWIHSTIQNRGTFLGGNAISLLARLEDITQEDLSGTDLHGADLSNLGLDGLVLRGCDLSDINFDFTYLGYVDKEGSNLEGISNNLDFKGNLVAVEGKNLFIILGKDLIVLDYTTNKEVARLVKPKMVGYGNSGLSVSPEGDKIAFYTCEGNHYEMCCYDITKKTVIARYPLPDEEGYRGTTRSIKLSFLDSNNLIVAYEMVYPHDSSGKKLFREMTKIFADVINVTSGQVTNNLLYSNNANVSFDIYDANFKDGFVASFLSHDWIDEDNNPTHGVTNLYHIFPNLEIGSGCRVASGSSKWLRFRPNKNSAVLVHGGHTGKYNLSLLNLGLNSVEEISPPFIGVHDQIAYLPTHDVVVVCDSFDYDDSARARNCFFDINLREIKDLGIQNIIKSQIFVTDQGIVYSTSEGIKFSEINLSERVIVKKQTFYIPGGHEFDVN